MNESRHRLDPYPLPKDSAPIYINEPWLIDKSIDEDQPSGEPEALEDNVRVYVPLDINSFAIQRRLNSIILQYDEVTEDNELDFEQDVRMIVSQIEIYDRIWFVRHLPADGSRHSAEGIKLVKDVISILENIPDGCAETFPLDLIDELKEEYFYDSKDD